MSFLQNIIQQFAPIRLDEMNDVKLLTREDTKMAFPFSSLPRFLDGILPYYRILEMNNARGLEYESLYFDTPAFDFYNQHHNGQLKRYKVRFRKYLNSGEVFLEVKCKNNREKTVKQRIRQHAIQRDFNNESKTFLDNNIPVKSETLSAMLWIYYTRYTFVHKTRKERLTIDLNMRFQSMDSAACAGNRIPDNLVIAELKQEKISYTSEFMQLMRRQRLEPLRFSKYCMASLSLFPQLRHNMFKPKLLALNKICNGTIHE